MWSGFDRRCSLDSGELTSAGYTIKISTPAALQTHSASSRSSLGHACITAWLFIAALSQLLYLAHWPMHVFGVPVAWLPAGLVALTRLGVYSALAWGMLERRREAWAATILELLRSLVCFMVPVVFGDRTASAYPTAWAQGLLTAALPLLLIIDVCLANGWRPHQALEAWLALMLRLWGASAVIAAMWLRRHDEGFDLKPPGGWIGLLKEGLPLVMLMGFVEGAALFWSLAARFR